MAHLNRNIFLTLAGAVVLAGCGTTASIESPEALASLDQPILIVELPETQSEAGAQLLRAEGDIEIWGTLNGIQFTFDQGVLRSTRGLAGDLMSADISEVQSALRAGGTGAVRSHRYLNGEDQEIVRALVCDVTMAGREQIGVLTGTFSTRKVVETCTSSAETIENRYWIDTRGLLRRSQQWIGPDAGYVVTERIND